MATQLRTPATDLATENAKLKRIIASLMDRVERSTDLQGNAFSLFETAISLESKVRARTIDLEQALDALAHSNAALAQAKEIADDAQRRLRDAIESINEGFAIFDGEDRLVLCNKTYLGLWPTVADRIVPGVTFDEIVALVGDSGTTLNAMAAPAHWVSQRLAQHSIASGGHVQALADGRWIQTNEMRTSEGGIVGIYTDITEVKAQDARARARELAEKSMTLQATLDNIQHGVCVYDADRRLIAWNDPLIALLHLPAAVLSRIGDHGAMVAHCRGVTTDALGDGDLAWLPADAPEPALLRMTVGARTLEVRRSAMPGGGMVIGFSDVTEALRASMTLRETNEMLERRVTERTADIAAVNSKLHQEIGERLAMEEALRDAKTAAEQANLSKTRFLAAASHDLLQPLNAARLFVAALGDRRLAAPSFALVRQAGAALDSVEDLLESLLEISRLDAGAIAVEPVDFAIDEILRAMKAEFTPVARAAGLVLRIEDCGEWVHSDPRLLRRILQNLISNAVRYTRDGSVDVTARRAGGRLHVEVVDTGSGIAAHHHQEIFEEFRRVDDSGRGIGLGLAIVQRASRMLGHALSLDSRLGSGSRFGVFVPVGTPRDIAVEPVAAVRGGQLNGLSILVIDNEETILEGMGALLEGWGCRVATARDKSAALAALTGATPDIVIADYHLDDGRTGDDAIAAVRAACDAPVPAIVVTADRTPGLTEELTKAGLQVLKKPVKPAQLRALITRITQ